MLTLIAPLMMTSHCFSMEKAISPLAKHRKEQAQLQLDSNLLRAIKTGAVPQVQQLMANLANPLKQDENGKSALQVAYELGNPCVTCLTFTRRNLPSDLWLLIQAYIEGDINRASDISEALANTKEYIGKNPQLMSYLLRKKFGQQILNKALLTCCVNGSVSNVELLISIGAQVNCVNRANESPIYLAALCNSNANKIIQVLLKVSANVNIRTIGGSSALMVTSQVATPDGKERVAMLLQAGANPHFRDNMHNMTALDYAKTNLKLNGQGKQIQEEVIKLLEAAEKSYQSE